MNVCGLSHLVCGVLLEQPELTEQAVGGLVMVPALAVFICSVKEVTGFLLRLRESVLWSLRQERLQKSCFGRRFLGNQKEMKERIVRRRPGHSMLAGMNL